MLALRGRLAFGTLLFSCFLFLLGTNFIKGTVLKFKAPNLTEEETHGKFMPSNLLCDACKAIAYQVNINDISMEVLSRLNDICIILRHLTNSKASAICINISSMTLPNLRSLTSWNLLAIPNFTNREFLIDNLLNNIKINLINKFSFYARYGVKTIDGINRLNGQGMKDAEKVPGMTSGGGKWPGRWTLEVLLFVQLCINF